MAITEAISQAGGLDFCVDRLISTDSSVRGPTSGKSFSAMLAVEEAFFTDIIFFSPGVRLLFQTQPDDVLLYD